MPHLIYKPRKTEGDEINYFLMISDEENSNTVYINYINYKVSDEELGAFFKEHGLNPSKVWIARRGMRQKSKGWDGRGVFILTWYTYETCSHKMSEKLPGNERRNGSLPMTLLGVQCVLSNLFQRAVTDLWKVLFPYVVWILTCKKKIISMEWRDAWPSEE